MVYEKDFSQSYSLERVTHLFTAEDYSNLIFGCTKAKTFTVIDEENGKFIKVSIVGLQHITLEKEIPKLISLLDQSDDRIRRSSATSLGVMNVEEAVSKLIELSKETEYKSAFNTALMKIGSIQAIEYISNLIENSEGD